MNYTLSTSTLKILLFKAYSQAVLDGYEAAKTSDEITERCEDVWKDSLHVVNLLNLTANIEQQVETITEKL